MEWIPSVYIGNLLVKNGNIKEAEGAYRSSLEIAQTFEDPIAIANAQFNLSFILIKNGQKQEAKDILKKCAAVYKERGQQGKWQKCNKMLKSI